MATAVVAKEFGGPDALSVIETQVPAPGPGEVTVEVRAAGVNPIDFKSYSGDFGRDPAQLPKRLGLEVAGVVTAVGPDAAGPAGPIAVGDAVIAFRVTDGYASAVTVPAGVVVPKPAELSWEQAAGLLLVGATAVHAVATVAAGSLALVDRDRIVSIAAFGRGDTGIRLIGGGPGADPGTEIRANAWRTLLPLAATGRLTLLPTRAYPLDQAAAAHELLRDGHPNGKLVLVPER